MAKLLIKRNPNIPDYGKYLGRFVGADIVTKTPTGEPCNCLVVTVELNGSKDRSGQPFRVSKSYNLDARGPNSFSRDYTSWSDEELSHDQLENFDTDALLLNKELMVEISHRKEGVYTVPLITSFKPAHAFYEDVDDEKEDDADADADSDDADVDGDDEAAKDKE
jgi:hypothetical protein